MFGVSELSCLRCFFKEDGLGWWGAGGGISIYFLMIFQLESLDCENNGGARPI